MSAYPKRLIEVDLPIKRISAHARREKSIRHGHISTLHIWWARRPLAACRAVILGALWPDPGDENCPERFRKEARERMLHWARDNAAKASAESFDRLMRIQKSSSVLDDPVELRKCLLDFIADFANWDNSNDPAYLETSRALVQVAHEALGGAPGTRPLVVDPFAGGGSIPLEALRVGADAFASDLNPVAVLLNKVVLEYIPRYGQRLADEVRAWGELVKDEAERELAEFYPKDPDGATPIAYLWARTVTCEGPGCGAEVPLIRSVWLAKKAAQSVALRLLPEPTAKRVDLQLVEKRGAGWFSVEGHGDHVPRPPSGGTVKRGSATCPCCGYTTPVTRVREQLRARHGGTSDARLLCVVTTHPSESGRSFRLPVERDLSTLARARERLTKEQANQKGPTAMLPGEPLPIMSGVFNAPLYGHSTWGSLFTPRQLLGLTTLTRIVRDVGQRMPASTPKDLREATQLVLALGVSRIADISNALCTWKASMVQAIHLFTRQAIPMMWDFTETTLLSRAAGDYETTISNMLRILEGEAGRSACGHVERGSAARHSLPDDSGAAFITDPPYYNAVPYADLSDFFYVWLKRMLSSTFSDLFEGELTPKDDEACQMSGWDPVRYPHKDARWFEVEMSKAMAEGRRLLHPKGVGVVVFAHKSTSGWEAQLAAMIDSGWVITGSWSIDTELANRLRAVGSAALASSVHLVCRPRENPDGSLRTDAIGDWRDVLSELPKRVHEWMPRLAEEGVVGADAIFACLGPALEVFSRYSRVEKASGEQVTLKEYLEHVWAAVAKEALSVIFAGAETSGFEEDARLTAMWLWTLSTGDAEASSEEEESDEDEDDGKADKRAKLAGFALEYDAARKIAQGLGAHLEGLTSLVEIKGETARLLPVGERTHALFGKDDSDAPAARRKNKAKQMKLGFADELEEAEEAGAWGQKGAPRPGQTVLDRVHQSMILFAAGRGEALRRFLVDESAGRDARFWRLAQALAALYPIGTDERRWVEGVLARKKSLGL